MSNVNFDELLLGAEKPSRYIGAEVNAVHKDQAEVRFLLAFPDTYEVGMSHLVCRFYIPFLMKFPTLRQNVVSQSGRTEKGNCARANYL